MITNEPYLGGPIDDLKIVRCYFWYGNCNQIIENNLINENSIHEFRKNQIWYKVDKFVDLNGKPSNKWAFYHDYLYVHKITSNKFNPKPIVDITIGKPGSTQPPYYVLKDSDTRQTSKVRMDSTINFDHWQLRNDVIWIKFGDEHSTDYIDDIMIFFGEDIIEPRLDWKLSLGSIHLNTKFNLKLSFHQNLINFDDSEILLLKESKDGNFKILQLSDFHFTENFGNCKNPLATINDSICQSTSKTLNLIHQFLDLEKPDLVVITGDLVDGFKTFDYEASILKVLSPFISRKIPYAIALGEMDTNKFVPRFDLIEFIASLPFSILSNLNKNTNSEISNYNITILNENNKIVDMVYILDIYSDDNVEILNNFKSNYENSIEKPKLSIEFQHYPIKEYRPKTSFALVGPFEQQGRINVKTDPNTKKILNEMDVKVMSVGYDHDNECCIENNDGFWMCYGGTISQNAYSKSGDRKIRAFNLNSQTSEIATWKRRQSEPLEVFDYQIIYKKE